MTAKMRTLEDHERLPVNGEITDDEQIEQLARLPKIEYDKQRKTVAKRMGILAATLDTEVKEAKKRYAKESEQSEEENGYDIEALTASAAEIIVSNNILDIFEREWRGVTAGEENNAKLLFLIATSRLFKKTMHAAVKGPSSSGKSEIRKQVLRFFPPEQIIEFTSMSERALLYFKQPFSHKILSMGEAAGTDEQSFQDYLLRELISESHLRYLVPMKNPESGEIETVVVEKDGPVTFLVTTTKRKLHQENETRMLSLDVDDSHEQTRRAMAKIAEVEGMNKESTTDYGKWQDFQRWLGEGDIEVVIPFALKLAHMIPANAVRLRRDLGQILRAFKAHALLHKNHRKRDKAGHIVANIENDYAMVRDLMEDLLAESAGQKIPEAVIRVVDVVKADGGEMNAKQVGAALKIDASQAYRQLGRAMDLGLIRNEEDRPRRKGRYVATNETVDPGRVLPTVEELKKAMTEVPKTDRLQGDCISGGHSLNHGKQTQKDDRLRECTNVSDLPPGAKTQLSKIEAALQIGDGGDEERAAIMAENGCPICHREITENQEVVLVANKGNIHEGCYDEWFASMK